MTVTNKPTWNDGQLRSVQLIVNGFPDNTDEPALPDELFLSNMEGERLVEIYRENDQWHVRTNPKAEYYFDGFTGAFKRGLSLARKEVEQ